jgi:hypothetical protein
MLTQSPPASGNRLTWESLTAGQQRQLTSHLARLLRQYLAAHQATSRPPITQQMSTKERADEQPTS